MGVLPPTTPFEGWPSPPEVTTSYSKRDVRKAAMATTALAARVWGSLSGWSIIIWREYARGPWESGVSKLANSSFKGVEISPSSSSPNTSRTLSAAASRPPASLWTRTNAMSYQSFRRPRTRTAAILAKKNPARHEVSFSTASSSRRNQVEGHTSCRERLNMPRKMNGRMRYSRSTAYGSNDQVCERNGGRDVVGGCRNAMLGCANIRNSEDIPSGHS